MTVVLVEGESDRAALVRLAALRGVAIDAGQIVAIGGAHAARRSVADLTGERVLGLVDRAEAPIFVGLVDEVFVCDRDLEDELIRSLGVDTVLAVLDEQGELASFRRLQQQPAQREHTVTDQLRRFFGGRSGNKSRYAGLLVEAGYPDAIPAPLAAVLDAAVRREI